MATSTHYPRRSRGRTRPPLAYPRRPLTLLDLSGPGHAPGFQPLNPLRDGGGEIRRFQTPPIRPGGMSGNPPLSWSKNRVVSNDQAPNGVRSMSRRFIIATRNLHVAGQYVRSYIFMGDRRQAKIYRYPNVLYTTHYGNNKVKPFIRNRIRTLGSRIPPVNSPNPDAYGVSGAPYSGGMQ